MGMLDRRRFLAGLASTGSGISLARAQPIEPARPREPIPAAAASGMRFVWYGSSASVPGVRRQIEPDPQGNWYNTLTGQRVFREFDTPSSSGAGFVVFDVLSAEDNRFLSWMTTHLIRPDVGNATTITDANGILSGMPTFGDVWFPPPQLAGFADQNEPDLRVLRGPASVGGKTYQALRFQSRGPDGWAQYTYDLDSGLLLVSSSTTQGGPVLTLDPSRRPVLGAGNTLLTYTQFSGARRTTLPGPDAAYPAQVRRLRAFQYNGTRGIVMAGSDLQLPPTGLSIRYDITSNSGSYLNARMTVSGLTGGTSERLIPAGVIGSLWMEPDVIGRYRAGQVLDRDALTGVQTLVFEQQSDLVLLGTRTALAQQTFGYNRRSGILTRSELRQQVGPATDIIAMQLAGTQ